LLITVPSRSLIIVPRIIKFHSSPFSISPSIPSHLLSSVVILSHYLLFLFLLLFGISLSFHYPHRLLISSSSFSVQSISSSSSLIFLPFLFLHHVFSLVILLTMLTELFLHLLHSPRLPLPLFPSTRIFSSAYSRHSSIIFTCFFLYSHVSSTQFFTSSPYLILSSSYSHLLHSPLHIVSQSRSVSSSTRISSAPFSTSSPSLVLFLLLLVSPPFHSPHRLPVSFCFSYSHRLRSHLHIASQSRFVLPPTRISSTPFSTSSPSLVLFLLLLASPPLPSPHRLPVSYCFSY
jgi:hypothetical protein